MARKRSKSKEKKSTVVKEQAGISVEYRLALEAYWNGQNCKAIETLTQRLEDESVTMAEAFALYRLWIEVLAAQNETLALRNLSEHLAFHHEVGAENAHLVTHTALRGLIHFELDEFEAATLMARSVRHDQDNIYVAELLQRCENRVAFQQPKSILWTIRNKLWDYVVLETLVRTARLAQEKSQYEWATKAVQAHYPNSPLPSQFQLHGWIEGGDFKAAKQLAGDLAKRFPQNGEFAFQSGYTAAQSGDFDNAITEFTRASHLFQNEDPDVFSWLGYSLAKKAIASRNQVLRGEAESYLKKAVELFHNMGLPTTFPSQQLSVLARQFSGKGQNSTGRLWMAKYDAGEFNQLKTAQRDAINFISRPLGKDAKAGDLVLIMGDDYVSRDARGRSTVWRLGALYLVASQPYWHPYKGYMSDLELVNRQEGLSIPIDVSGFIAHQNGDGKIGDRGNPRLFGVFELDAQAQNEIAQALEQYSDQSFDMYDRISHFRQSVS